MLVTMVAKEFRFNDTVQNHDVSPVFLVVPAPTSCEDEAKTRANMRLASRTDPIADLGKPGACTTPGISLAKSDIK